MHVHVYSHSDGGVKLVIDNYDDGTDKDRYCDCQSITVVCSLYI